MKGFLMSLRLARGTKDYPAGLQFILLRKNCTSTDLKVNELKRSFKQKLSQFFQVLYNNKFAQFTLVWKVFSFMVTFEFFISLISYQSEEGPLWFIVNTSKQNQSPLPFHHHHHHHEFAWLMRRGRWDCKGSGNTQWIKVGFETTIKTEYELWWI